MSPRESRSIEDRIRRIERHQRILTCFLLIVLLPLAIYSQWSTQRFRDERVRLGRETEEHHGEIQRQAEEWSRLLRQGLSSTLEQHQRWVEETAPRNGDRAAYRESDEEPK